jgi:AAA domain/TrwC relaxase
VIWDAGRKAMADLEEYSTARVRKGGRQDDRRTGNIIWYGWEHPETRPNRDDGMPDMDRHIHFVVMNLTYDPVEKEWKAMKFRDIMDLRKYFDRRFDMHVASGMTALGYEVETKLKSDGKGGKRYFSWDIKGIPDSVVKKFSRRAGVIDALADELGIENPRSKDKLGGTTRLHKPKDMTLADYRAYWDGRFTPEESRAIGETIAAALLGQNAKPQNTADKAVRYAIDHIFERQSVIGWNDLAITAMERSMGGAKPDDILPEARRQGVLSRNGEATTKEVLAEEGRVIAFAREGRGTMRPMGPRAGLVHELRRPIFPRAFDTTAANLDPARPSRERQAGDRVGDVNEMAGLSPEQSAIARHVWDSPDRVILIRGAAGTGKTHTMRTTIQGIDRPVVVLAPSAEASRGVLRKEGFTEADTVARFLMDDDFQQQAEGGVIWVDEAGLLGIRQVRQVFDAAERLGARVVLQGDRRQHGSVERGATLRVLEEFAGLPVAELKDIRRQRGQYKQAVESLSRGDILAGYDKLDDLGWVQQVDGNEPLVDDYLSGLRAGKELLVVAPTHAEGDEITAEIRAKLKERGIVSRDEQVLEVLEPLGWTDAEKSDLGRYDGTEVMQFHRNSGSFKAGSRIRVVDWKHGQAPGKPQHYSVFSRTNLAIASGDTIRITANGHDRSGKHRLDNGSRYAVAGFTKEGDVALSNGWVLGKDFGHITHGYVTTSHASQGKTVDRVLIAMGSESLPAINAEQFYVSVSRGRESAKVYSDLAPNSLRDAIQKTDSRKSATELMNPKRKRRSFMQTLRDRYERLRDHTRDAIRAATRTQEQEHGLSR